MLFKDPYLNKITCTNPFRQKTYHFQEIVILKQQNVKSVTDASIWKKFISKNSNTLEIEHSLLNSPIIINAMYFISGQLISLTNPIHRIPCQYVNKPQILFCDRALLNSI